MRYGFIDECIREFESQISRIGYDRTNCTDLYYFILKLNEHLVQKLGEEIQK